MILEHERFLWIVFLIRLESDIGGGPLELDVILNEYAIMNDRHVTWCHHGPILGKAGSAEENVVALPLTWFAARVDERDVLLVNARGLAVRISRIVVRVQDLNLVPSLEKDSAIRATLSFAFDLCGSAPLDVKLAIAEGALRLDVPGRLDHGKSVFGDFPFRRAPIRVLPFGEILPVEQHDRVRGRRRAYSWSYYARYGFPNLRELRVSLGLLRLCGMDER